MFVIVSGFGIFLFSSFPPTQRFGLAIVFGTTVAALTALYIMPAAARIPFYPAALRRSSAKIT